MEAPGAWLSGGLSRLYSLVPKAVNCLLLLQDTNIIDKRLTKTDVDLIFTKVKVSARTERDPPCAAGRLCWLLSHHSKSSRMWGGLTNTHASVLQAKGERRIDFNAFVEALQQIADKKCTTLDAIMAQVVAAGGPT